MQRTGDDGQLTREVRMKKIFIIIALATLQSGCSTQAAQPNPKGALLSFTDLAAEITVRHEVSTAVPVSSRTTGDSFTDSS